MPTKMPTLVAVRIQRGLWYNIYARTIYANIRENINTHYVPLLIFFIIVFVLSYYRV
jgi:hypothetical protein